MEFGEALRYIRVSKNLRQEDIAHGIMEVSSYARIERGETTNIASWRLNLILDKFNISYEEFWYIKNNYQPTEKDEMTTEIFNYYLKKDFDHLRKLEILADERYKETSDIHYQFLSIMAYCTSKNLDTKKIDPQRTEPVVTYLYNQESWLRYEIVLFINFMFAFDIEDVLRLAGRVLKRSEKFWKFHYNEGEPSILLLLNLISFCLDHGRIQEAKKFSSMAKEKLDGRYYLLERNRLHFYNGIIQLKENKTNTGLQLCEDAIRVLETLDLSNVASTYRDYLAKFYP